MVGQMKKLSTICHPTTARCCTFTCTDDSPGTNRNSSYLGSSFWLPFLWGAQTLDPVFACNATELVMQIEECPPWKDPSLGIVSSAPRQHYPPTKKFRCHHSPTCPLLCESGHGSFCRTLCLRYYRLEELTPAGPLNAIGILGGQSVTDQGMESPPRTQCLPICLPGNVDHAYFLVPCLSCFQSAHYVLPFHFQLACRRGE